MSDCSRRADEKLCIGAIVEEQLKMLRIQSELTEATANLAGKRVVRGWPGPSFTSCLVHELEKAPIAEEQAGFGELRVRDVIGHVAKSKIGERQGRSLIFC